MTYRADSPILARIPGKTVAEVKKQVEWHRQRLRDYLRVRFHVADADGNCPCGRHYRQCCRQEISPQFYSILPLTVEELPGTEWRNAHTFVYEGVETLDEDRFGRIGPDPGKRMGAGFSIGLWRRVQDREIFCVEHWVRVDDLPAEERIEWAKARIVWARKKVVESEKAILEADRRNRRGRERDLEWAERYVEEAQADLIALADRLDVPLSVNVLNVGIQPGEQMAMF